MDLRDPSQEVFNLLSREAMGSLTLREAPGGFKVETTSQTAAELLLAFNSKRLNSGHTLYVGN